MVASLCAPTLFNCVQTENGSYEYVTDGTIVESYNCIAFFKGVPAFSRRGRRFFPCKIPFSLSY